VSALPDHHLDADFFLALSPHFSDSAQSRWVRLCGFHPLRATASTPCTIDFSRASTLVTHSSQSTPTSGSRGSSCGSIPAGHGAVVCVRMLDALLSTLETHGRVREDEDSGTLTCSYTGYKSWLRAENTEQILSRHASKFLVAGDKFCLPKKKHSNCRRGGPPLQSATVKQCYRRVEVRLFLQ